MLQVCRDDAGPHAQLYRGGPLLWSGATMLGDMLNFSSHAGVSRSKSCLVSVPTGMKRAALPSVEYVALALVKFRVVVDPSW